MKAASTIRVLVIDDSAIVRKLASEALNADPEIEVVGTATDPYIGRDKIVELQPDVVTLDIEMPRMDGITFLKILMKHKPLPVIIMSSLTQRGSAYAMEALEAGAVDVLAKPSTAYSVGDLSDELVRKVKAAYLARHRLVRRTPAPAAPAAAPADAEERPAAGSRAFAPATALRPAAPKSRLPSVPFDARTVVLLGASTGGTEALKDVLVDLPKAMPGICIVQHIPAYFSGAFASRLNDLCELDVKEAQDGDIVKPGTVLIAPGDYHMLLARSPSSPSGYMVHLKQGPKIWHQRPAVDLLFRSAAPITGRNAVVGLLTGMGQDGAEGLLEMRQAGARTFAQDEATCVVFGMPHAAQKIGAPEKMVPLHHIAQHILNLTRKA